MSCVACVNGKEAMRTLLEILHVIALVAFPFHYFHSMIDLVMNALRCTRTFCVLCTRCLTGAASRGTNNTRENQCVPSDNFMYIREINERLLYRLTIVSLLFDRSFIMNLFLSVATLLALSLEGIDSQVGTLY